MDEEDPIGEINPIRYRSYYYDDEIGLYYLRARYYDPETGRFISQDNISYLDSEHLSGLNLYAYCNNIPVMGYDPCGTWNWGNFWKVVGAVAIVVAVTAVTVATAGVAAYALGASAAVVGAVATGAAIGGVVAGGLEVGMQIASNGIEGMDLGSVAIETFSGAAYGAITGAMGTTTSVGGRVAMRASLATLSGVTSIMHGINEGNNSFASIMSNAGQAVITGIAIQGTLLGLDVVTGHTIGSVLESYKMDGAMEYGVKQIVSAVGIISVKNLLKHKEFWGNVCRNTIADATVNRWLNWIKNKINTW